MRRRRHPAHPPAPPQPPMQPLPSRARPRPCQRPACRCSGRSSSGKRQPHSRSTSAGSRPAAWHLLPWATPPAATCSSRQHSSELPWRHAAPAGWLQMRCRRWRGCASSAGWVSPARMPAALAPFAPPACPTLPGCSPAPGPHACIPHSRDTPGAHMTPACVQKACHAMAQGEASAAGVARPSSDMLLLHDISRREAGRQLLTS
jgi:hypothetical protein